MGKFNFIKTSIEGVTIIEPTVFGDQRGYFMETYNKGEFDAAGLNMVFVQDNESKSKKGVLRGLHFQKKNPQGKLVRVNKKQFYIPEGFAHGFVVLSETATFVYKCTRLYDPKDEGGLMWNDPEIGIKWPVGNGFEPLLSEKDTKNPPLKDLGFAFEV